MRIFTSRPIFSSSRLKKSKFSSKVSRSKNAQGQVSSASTCCKVSSGYRKENFGATAFGLINRNVVFKNYKPYVWSVRRHRERRLRGSLRAALQRDVIFQVHGL